MLKLYYLGWGRPAPAGPACLHVPVTLVTNTITLIACCQTHYPEQPLSAESHMRASFVLAVVRMLADKHGSALRPYIGSVAYSAASA